MVEHTVKPIETDNRFWLDDKSELKKKHEKYLERVYLSFSSLWSLFLIHKGRCLEDSLTFFFFPPLIFISQKY